MGTPRDRKPRLYAKLNSFAWRERWQSLYILVLIGFAALLALLFFALSQIDHWKEGSQLTGTIVDLAEMEMDERTLVAPLVDLDSGPVVGLSYMPKQGFEKGQRVVVQEYVSDIVRGRRYKFVALINPD